MCGISGYINFNEKHPIDASITELLKNSIKHRGPDDNGVFISNNVGLVHTRLSIIDLKTGEQPMNSYNDQCTIVFNGEIYNFLDLRQELIQCGHEFKTMSDTEVILNSYLEWGVDCFNKFNGEWAIALWDQKQKSLLLSRDRYGIKPFYYKKTNESLIFSSELKSFNALGDVEIDKEELWDLLVYGPKPGGKTFVKGVNELLPGHFISVKKDAVTVEEYYSLEDTLKSTKVSPNFDYLEELMIDSVKVRLMSDVSLGTINSGGLDSSLVSKIAKDHLPDDLFTFSVAPNRVNNVVLPGDESKYAQLLADQIKSTHKTIRYSQDLFFEELKKCLFFNDGPLFHSNSIPLSHMFKVIRKENDIRVLLGGEGADEVFRGYSFNRIANIYSRFRSFGLGFLFKKLMRSKYPRLKKISRSFSHLSFYAQLAMDRSMFMDPEDANKLLGIQGSMSDDRLLILEKMQKLPAENQLIYYEQKCYLTGLLQRVDRMSMRWGVEARVPFLDHRLVNYINSISPKYKSGFTEKKVKKMLKKIAASHIEPTIINRKKYGFSSPLDKYKQEMGAKMQTNFKEEMTLDLKGLSSQDTFLVYNYLLMKQQYSG